jgi:hypothetical protein
MNIGYLRESQTERTLYDGQHIGGCITLKWILERDWGEWSDLAQGTAIGGLL